MYKKLTALKRHYRRERILDLFLDPEIKEKLAHTPMFWRGEEITFYWNGSELRYYHLDRNGDWRVLIADEGFLHSIKILQYDFCKITGIPYKGPEIDKSVSVDVMPVRTRNQCKEEAEALFGMFGVGSLLALTSLYIYKAWKR
ncbi:hypothetical protein AVT69_gp194 [Pseudomonas phage PhiPA3]|uniref:Uncharacterized protein 196 n=1 Tax=Pseudomonas phage PhiPA3 TaxID=998086 RepID=F8SK64_BPPA3|nr:hypothetical protein AVT69_gp194 [Pseudomonas phage PhiPA3]AEH03619.1 hypothetical protein [Pseudomonas phage PhiPA3]